ncbi:MAG: aldo/keto reductase [Ruminococcaceae bacterium]|nr:aldo/keto reductase [Oscillospiraceae bacterium]
MNKLTDTYTLKNGVQIPCIGYGTWQTPDGATARDSVKCALECGYRHIDTAAAYGNESSVGEGIRLSGVKREDIFVTTKHWIADRGYDKTILACEKSLKELGMDYVDLYLIHWPCVAKISENWAEINADTWRGFEKLYKDGKIRAIGVSNFLPSHLEALKKVCEIAPMVNQIEHHPGYYQKEVVDYCQANDMLVQAWSPLGCGAVLKDPTVNAIAEKYNKTAAHICIRYAMERNILPLPKSVTPSRIADNTKVFDFTLAPEDLATLDAMPKTGYSGYYPDEAPADAL